MNNADIIKSFWETMDKQYWNRLKDFFIDSAIVEWPNTNELFNNIDNFICANSEYPGSWSIEVERIEAINDKVITAVKVSLKGENISFYAVSFFELIDEKIKKLTEYWGDNGDAPEWRRRLNLSIPLKS